MSEGFSSLYMTWGFRRRQNKPSFWPWPLCTLHQSLWFQSIVISWNHLHQHQLQAALLEQVAGTALVWTSHFLLCTGCMFRELYGGGFLPVPASLCSLFNSCHMSQSVIIFFMTIVTHGCVWEVNWTVHGAVVRRFSSLIISNPLL